MGAEVVVEDAAGLVAAKPVLAKACSERDYYSGEGTFQRWASSRGFTSAGLLVTTFFLVWLAIDCDTNPSSTLPEAPVIFIVMRWLFVLFYSVELCVRFMAFQSKGNAFKCLGFNLDIILLLELILASCIPAGSHVSIQRLVKILDFVQFARIGRLIQAAPALRVLFSGLAAAFKALLWCVLMFTCFIYLFAIAFTRIRAETENSETYFGTVARSMWTLWTHGILTGSPGELAEAISENEGGGAVALFVIFWVMSFSMLVIMAGVTCDVASAVASVEKDKFITAYLVEALRKVQCSSAFWTSKQGFLHGLQAEPGTVLQQHGIDLEELAEFADSLFADGAFASLDKLAGEIASIGMPGSDRDNIRKSVRRDIMRLERRLLRSTGNQ